MSKLTRNISIFMKNIGIMKRINIIGALSILAMSLSVVSCHSTDINVMTFNVRYDNPSDLPSNWDSRKEIVVDVIRDNDVDICGMQEVLAHQLDYLKDELQDYVFVGVARDDGKRSGEFSNIIFKADKFKLKESGTFWLSETPDVVGSFGWDAACTRIATWVVVEGIDSGKELFFINTHLDHAGVLARENGTALLLDKFRALSGDKPAIIVGDFNASPESNIIKQVTDSGLVADSRSVAEAIVGEAFTYHSFGKLPVEQRPIIDYIFVNNYIKVSKHATIFRDQIPYISDHNPILVTLTIW